MTTPEGSMVHGPKAMLTKLPSVDRLIHTPIGARLQAEHGPLFVTRQARELLAQWRADLLSDPVPSRVTSLWQDNADMTDAIAQALAQRCAQRLEPCMRSVINLTGTAIHTNLGRAVLPQAAIDHVVAMMAGPNNLEYDLQSGRRGDRDSVVEGLLCELTGAEAATVVNNNAAAVLLSLAALAGGREAVVSRGEQVEIGGAFRMPDVMASAGARMVEVGTTNRTHLADYERAITAQTALLMKVHTSNYAVQGFTASVSEAELAPLARERGVWLVTDLGSGSLIDMSAYGLPKEPTPQEMLTAGCHVVTFSGDKLLGGPQAGLIVGDREAIGRIRKFPMKRALRLSKLPLAALEATLQLYLRPDWLTRDLPTLRWLTRPVEQIQAMAQRLCAPMAQAVAPRFAVEVVSLQSQIGSGSLPVDRLPSAGLAMTPVSAKGVGRQLDELATVMRGLPQPVIGRIDSDRLLLDLRCLDQAEALLVQLPTLQAQLGARP